MSEDLKREIERFELLKEKLDPRKVMDIVHEHGQGKFNERVTQEELRDVNNDLEKLL